MKTQYTKSGESEFTSEISSVVKCPDARQVKEDYRRIISENGPLLRLCVMTLIMVSHFADSAIKRSQDTNRCTNLFL